MNVIKVCEYAVNPSGDCYECSAYKRVDCEDQIYDRNDDGSMNAVICGLASEEDYERV